MILPIDIADALDRANRDHTIRLKARANLVGLVKALFDHQDRDEPHISDTGRCARELWADLRDLHDIEPDFKTQLTRFDGGHLMGAWEASLLKEFIEAEYPAYTVYCEKELEIDGVVGRTDFIVYHTATAKAVWAVDFKLTWFSKAEEKDNQRLQVSTYAAAAGAPVASIFLIAPSAYSAKPWYLQSDYSVADEMASVERELRRIKAAAFSETMPDGDPQESWRCTTCAFSACDRNRNPRKPEYGAPITEETVVVI